MTVFEVYTRWSRPRTGCDGFAAHEAAADVGQGVDLFNMERDDGKTATIIL